MNRDNDDAAECMCPVRWLENHPYNIDDDQEDISHTEHSFCNYSLESLGYDTDDHNCDHDFSDSTNADPYCDESIAGSFSNHSSCCLNGNGKNGDNGNPLFGDDDDDDEVDETVVRFGTISVREFAVTVADLPTSNDSCPLTLDWEYSSSDPVPLHRYERCRIKCRRKKPLHQLTLEERRQRVATTQGISLDCVKIMEVELMANQVLGKFRNLSQRDNDDPEDDDNHEHDDVDNDHDPQHHHHQQHEGPITALTGYELAAAAEERRSCFGVGGGGVVGKTDVVAKGGAFCDDSDNNNNNNIRRSVAATTKALSSSKVQDLSLENLLTAADVLSLRRPSRRKKSPMAVTA